MAETTEKKSGCGCGSCCLVVFVLSGLFAIVFGVITLMYGPRLVRYAVTEGPERLAGFVEDLALSQTKQPLPLRPPPPVTEAPAEFRSRLQAGILPGETGQPKKLRLDQADVNRLVRDAVGSGDVLEGMQVDLTTAGARIQASFRGTALMKWIPAEPPGSMTESMGPEGYKWLRSTLEKAAFVNVEAQVGPGKAGVRLEALKVLGLPLPVSTMQTVFEKAAQEKGLGKAGALMPGLKFLEGSVEVELPGAELPAWAGSGSDPGSK